MANTKILIIDDDINICELLRLYLEKDGFEAEVVTDGLKALDAFNAIQPDLVLLDIMLPGMDGWQICREIRKDSLTPIIMLTAKGEEFDKLLGLEMGADDYITKPFSPREVLARVKAVLRRMHELNPEDKSAHLVVGNLDIDMNAFTIKLNGHHVPCTPKETEILWTLASNPGMVFSREHLLQSIWGYDFLGDTRAVDSHIKRIRAKLCNPDNNWDIRTVWGVGYRFEVLDGKQN
jgi:DNA-binding response OmpR family regulator